MKKFLSSILTLIIATTFMNTVSANSEDNQIAKNSNSIVVKAELTNIESGEKQEFTSEVNIDSLENVRVLAENNGEQSFVAEGNIYVEFNKNTMKASLRDSQGSSKNEGGVTASATVYYTKKDNETKVNITRLLGKWVPEDNMYIVSGRRVILRQHQYGGKTMNQYPSSNKFDYNVSWGYIGIANGSAGPNVYTSANLAVAGMSGTSHYLELYFSF